LPAEGPREEHHLRALELLRRYDGGERISQLPFAQLVSIAPAADEDDPVAVQIVWSPGAIEHPFPGSSLWRAVLERHLDRPPDDGPADRVLRAQIERSLERYPDLESWWHWLRTGWTAPPKPEGARRGKRAERSTGWPWPW
jgi:hypothetical protein